MKRLFWDVTTRTAAASRVSGFSLIEIVLALGIISFAIVGIMGLFPVAMKSAQESRRETRATLIAQQIFSDLASMSGTNRSVTIGSNAADRINISLAGSSLVTIYFDESGIPVGTTAGADSLFLASVSVTPDTPVVGLSRIETAVETPVAAPAGSRASYQFVTLMNQ